MKIIHSVKKNVLLSRLNIRARNTTALMIMSSIPTLIHFSRFAYSALYSCIRRRYALCSLSCVVAGSFISPSIRSSSSGSSSCPSSKRSISENFVFFICSFSFLSLFFKPTPRFLSVFFLAIITSDIKSANSGFCRAKARLAAHRLSENILT